MERSERERLSVEEIANCATHGFGLVLSVAGLVALVLLAWFYGDGWDVLLSGGVYGASLVTLYLASTLYHGARSMRAKNFLQVVDHCCIYLLIAGTYTPFTLVMLRGGWGWTLFGLVWGIAVAGILFRLVFGNRYRPVAVASYVLMGWLCVIAAKPILTHAPLGAILWIVAGGLAYTSGVFFFASERIPHSHAIWHLFVLGGSVCHYIAVVLYVLPSRT
ncbi:MAG TPA: hemolysin III family protein [Pyrinomonadaceae bacterium]|jgi:hemolysin III|nr:hemolysin III family protein [Pyrinomonadaceae bacterium]